jgi:hypothetical protein
MHKTPAHASTMQANETSGLDEKVVPVEILADLFEKQVGSVRKLPS